MATSESQIAFRRGADDSKSHMYVLEVVAA